MTEQRIRTALHDLSDAPVPSGLAQRALAASRRRRRVAVASVSMVVVGAATATALALMGRSGVAEQQTPVAQPTDVVCSYAPVHVVDGQPTVEEADWPRFVRVVMAALPAGLDYRVHSTAEWCGTPEARISSAEILVDDPADAATLTVWIYTDPWLFNCHDTLPMQEQELSEVAFCDPGPATPRAYGLVGPADTFVLAVHEGGPTIIVEYHHEGRAITPEQLREVATDPDLVGVVPAFVGAGEASVRGISTASDQSRSGPSGLQWVGIAALVAAAIAAGAVLRFRRRV